VQDIASKPPIQRSQHDISKNCLSRNVYSVVFSIIYHLHSPVVLVFPSLSFLSIKLWLYGTREQLNNRLVPIKESITSRFYHINHEITIKIMLKLLIRITRHFVIQYIASCQVTRMSKSYYYYNTCTCFKPIAMRRPGMDLINGTRRIQRIINGSTGACFVYKAGARICRCNNC
jgi:hypothetical protein